MQTFVDNTNRAWTVAVTVTGVKRVRATLGIDIPSLIENGSEGLAKLLGDPISLVDVIYVLCRDQAEKQGVTDEQFGEAMAGDAIQGASNAFLEAFADFFQEPRVRAGIRKMLVLSRKVTDLAMSEMTKTLESVDVDQEARKLIASFGTAPGSSESTPDLLPFES